MKGIFIQFMLLVLTGHSLLAQSQTHSISLFYAVNESRSEVNFKRLDSLLREIGTANKQFKIFAYADFLSNPSYNLKLSQARLHNIKSHIQSREGKKATFTETKAFGDEYSKENQSPFGEPNQRRVDVIINSIEERKKIGTTPIETQQKKGTSIQKTQTQKEITTLQKNITELKEGESLAIEGLSFIPGRHILMKSSIPVLEDLLNTLTQKDELRVEIQGHICCLTSDELDGLDLDTGEQKLSENRALAVYNYLVKNGIEPDRLTYKGYGHRYPKVLVERTPEDEQTNRRVEIKILENKTSETE